MLRTMFVSQLVRDNWDVVFLGSHLTWANCWMSSYRLWSSYEWEPFSQSGKFDRKPGFMTSRDKTTHIEMKSEMWSEDFFKVQWIDWQFGQKKNTECLLFVKKSCSKVGRRHLWRFVPVDKFLSGKRQVGRTWCGQLMTGFWQIFEL